MSMSATVNVSGSWLQSVTDGPVTSVQKCSLSSADTLSGGKVIVVTGTTDDSGGVTIDPGDTGFRDANGDLVVLDDVDRILFTANPGATARFGTGAVILNATGGRVAATCCIGAGDKNVRITANSGTSTYTLLMWEG